MAGLAARDRATQRPAAAGRPHAPLALSPRERELLQLLTDGLDVSHASVQLGLSVHTARAYVKSILRKFGVGTQLQAVLIGLRDGLVELPSDIGLRYAAERSTPILGNGPDELIHRSITPWKAS